jgi:hypothetical protein
MVEMEGCLIITDALQKLPVKSGLPKKTFIRGLLPVQ